MGKIYIVVALASSIALAAAHGVAFAAIGGGGQPAIRVSDARRVTSGPHEHLLANYFGINAWSHDFKKLLALETDLNGRLPEVEDACSIGLADVETGGFEPFAKTVCWNFQEGAMAHWLPSGEVLYNDLREGRFVTVVRDLASGRERTVPFPASAVSPDGRTMVSINYARLRLTRPDYGYPGEGQDAREGVQWPDDDGLWLVDLATGKGRLIVSIASCRDRMPQIGSAKGLAYFCHTVFSRDGSKIFWLARTVEGYDKANRKGDVGRKTVAFTCNADGTDVRRSFPDGWDVSHFNWKDGSTICVTAKFGAKKWSHVEYTVGDEAHAHMLGGGALDWDGHCTYSPDGKWLSTEGYRDAQNNRHWKLLRLSDGAVFDAGSFFVPEAYRPSYWRCDLHARWRSDGRQLAFNSTHEGSRQIYVRDMAVEGASQCGFSKADFKAPPPEFSPSFFWLWGGKLTADALKAEMDDMASHGAKTACIHPYPKAFRPKMVEVPMDPDFLTDGYFDLYGKTLEHIAGFGGRSWLYDEGGWPSGGACGRVYASDPKRFGERMLAAGGKVVEVAPNPAAAAPMPSVIEPGATEKFIELGYEPYRARFARHFGKTIRFAFTDEPGFPNRRGGERIPWCTDFAERFRERKGYDIMPFCDDLVASTNRSEAVTRARVDYYDVLSALLRERYFIAIRDWCRKNGLMFGGHLNGEDDPSCNARGNYGHALRCLRAMDVPGVDVIWRQLFPGANGRQAPFTKYASSAAHQNGGKYVMSETCAIYGHGMTPAQMKWLVDYQCLRGANMFVFSAYRARLTGKTIGMPGPCFGPINPQWPFMTTFFNGLARQCALLAQGEPCVRTAVLYDIRGIWAGGDDAKEAMDRHYAVSRKLLESQRDFDFVDDDQIAEAEMLPDGSLGIGAMRYSAVVLPTSRRMLPAARRKLDAFAARGGTVVENGDCEALAKVCEVAGEGARDIRAVKRTSGGEVLYFLVNESESPRRVRVRFDEAVPMARADPETGRFVEWPSSGGEFEWNAPGCGSLLLVSGVVADEPAPAVPAGPEIEIKDGWTMSVKSRLCIGPAALDVVEYHDTPALAMKLGDWREVLGGEFSGQVIYRVAFHSPSAGDAVLDLGEVHNCCAVKLNGSDLGSRYAGPYCWRVALRQGANELEVTVANAPVNALSAPHFRRYVTAAYPPESPYEWRVKVFNADGHESGLYGPVRARLVKPSGDAK